MLVLSRHRNGTIYIGDDVTVQVVDIRGDKVRLGINAPKDVPVHRGEIYELINKVNPSPDLQVDAKGVHVPNEQYLRLSAELEKLIMGYLMSHGYRSAPVAEYVERASRNVANRVVLAS